MFKSIRTTAFHENCVCVASGAPRILIQHNHMRYRIWLSKAFRLGKHDENWIRRTTMCDKHISVTYFDGIGFSALELL